MNLFSKTVLLSFALASTVQAQNISKLGSSRGYEIYAKQGSANARVGNAVLVRIVSTDAKNRSMFSSLVMLACDGSWVTNAIQAAAKMQNEGSLEEMFDYSKSKDKSPPLDIATIYPTAETNLFYAKVLSQHAQSLCKNAGKEPRNLLLPVTSASSEKSGGTSFAIVLGTATQEKGEIDIWIRLSEFKTVPILNRVGQPVTLEGIELKQNEPTGEYQMQRWTFHCKNRKVSIYEFVEYKDEQVQPKSSSISKNHAPQQSAVPNTIGEILLDSVCTIYEKR